MQDKGSHETTSVTRDSLKVKANMKIKDIVQDPKCHLTIAIEGPDRIGKQTQVQMLTRALSSRVGWEQSAHIETPIRDEHTHTRIYEMLRDGRAKKYPSTFQGLQIANRLIYQAQYLPTFLTQYDALVFDRWNASSYAYGRAAGLPAEELCCELDLVAEPDITIILDGPPFPKSDLDDYEKDMEFQSRVRSAYEEWARARPKGERVYIIDAGDTIEAVHATIWDIVTDFIPTLYNNVVDMQKWKVKHAGGARIKNVTRPNNNGPNAS